MLQKIAKLKNSAMGNKISKLLIVACITCLMMCTFCFATDGTETTQPTLNIDFEVTEMFSWAEMMINAMKPVMYITMGVGLAFLILGAFQAIFARSR